MDDEIDLRASIQAVARQWKLVGSVALLATLAAIAFALLSPRKYTAAALVVVAQPPYSLRLTDVNQGQVPTARTYAALAVSSDVISVTLQKVNAALPDQPLTERDLRSRIAAVPSADPTLLSLTATESDPGRAALIANTWADALATRAQALYGPDTLQVTQYETQLETAKASLTQAEQALATFQGQNKVPALSAELTSLEFSLTDYLDRQHRYGLLLQDAQDLQARLHGQEATALATPADEAGLLLLSAQVSSSSVQVNPSAVSNGPIQIQVAVGGPASGRTVGQLASGVSTFIDTLQARAKEAVAQADALQPELLRVQGQLASAQATERNLTLARDLAQDQYKTLATQVQQVHTAAQDAGDLVKVAGMASAPTVPAGVSRTLIVLVGIAAGLAGGVVLALARDWWQAPQPRPLDGHVVQALEREKL